MIIRSLASSSKGNAYLVSDGRSSLLLECGISIGKLMKLSEFSLANVAGCLLSHEHGDHSKAAGGIMQYGIDLYTSKGTACALSLSGHRLNTLEQFEYTEVGTFMVTAFDVCHNAAEPFGYLIRSKVTDERLAFFIDTFDVNYKFGRLNYIMAGVDYDEGSLQQSCDEEVIDVVLLDHIHENHMSLDTFKTWLSHNDLTYIKQIWILHLSQNNADPVKYKKELQRLTGKQIIVAGKEGEYE